MKVLKRDFSHVNDCACYDDCECEWDYDIDDVDCTCVCNCEQEDIKVIVGEDAETKGFLPFFSVDTEEEVHEVIRLALETGEFIESNGILYETTLMYDQTLENLSLAGERLKELYDNWKASA